MHYTINDIKNGLLEVNEEDNEDDMPDFSGFTGPISIELPPAQQLV